MTEVSAIGGYFGLELCQEQPQLFHGIGYSTLRGALQHVLERLVPKEAQRKLWLPRFICPAIWQAFASTRDRIEIVTYHIGRDLLPLDLNSAPDDLVYFYGPFGLISPPSTDGILVDSAHNLFQEALPGQYTFFSPRKFVGIPDGALLRSPLPPRALAAFQLDDRAAYLLRRIDQGAESGFGAFQAWEEQLYSGNVLGMSTFSRHILARVNPEQIKARRVENFLSLHKNLSSMNFLAGQIDNALKRSDFVPFSYPFLHANGQELRKLLVNSRIYTPILWNGLSCLNKFETYLANSTVHCPVDQRYNLGHMERIVSEIGSNLRLIKSVKSAPEI